MSDKLADSREYFRLAHEAEAENRALALEDMRFALLAEQWDERVVKQRTQENRPILTINRMQAIGRQVVNDARQNKPSIKVKPVDSGADIKTADIYSGIIRNIEQTSYASVAYDTGIECAVYGGFGYWRVKVDYAHDDSFDLDICIDRIANPFSVYGDPFSTACDASDWNRAFIVSQISEKEFKRRYPDAEISDWDSKDESVKLWITEDTVQIAEEWIREEVKRKIVKLNDGRVITADQYKQNIALFQAAGLQVTGERETRTHKVTQRIISGTEILEDTSEWAGKYIPICPVYGDEVNIEGKRYFKSLIRDAKDAQRMLNYWRTTSTELVALAPRAPWVGPVGSFETDRRWETANTANHAYLEYDPISGQPGPQRQPFAGVPAGALQEAMNASDDIKSITGLYDASLGARSNETSGRAIMARQREGDTATFHFIDNQQRAIRYTGQVLIDLIPKVYSGERVVRVLGVDGKADMVGVNDGAHDLARGKYDLVVQSGPSYTTKRDEFANTMIEFTRANPAAGALVMDKIVAAMDMPDAEEVAARFKAMLPPQIQQLEAQGEQNAEEVVGQLSQQLMQAQQQLQAMQQEMQQAQPAMAKLELDRNKAQMESMEAAERLRLEGEKMAREADLREKDLAIKASQTAIERERLDFEKTQFLVDAARQAAMVQPSEEIMEPVEQGPDIASLLQMQSESFQTTMQQIAQLTQLMAAPRRIVRGPDGRAAGVETVTGV